MGRSIEVTSSTAHASDTKDPREESPLEEPYTRAEGQEELGCTEARWTGRSLKQTLGSVKF